MSIFRFISRYFLGRKVKSSILKYQGNVKLHIGCGSDYFDGYVNIDSDKNSKADLLLGIKDYNYFPDQCVSRIESYHFFEHLTYFEAKEVIAQWYRILMPGGVLVIELPNLQACISNIGKYYNHKGYDLAMVGIYGYPPEIQKMGRPYMHKWGWSLDSLKNELSWLGFERIEHHPVRQSNRDAAIFNRDMKLTAEKPRSVSYLNRSVLVSRKYGLVYLPIPKVACSSLKYLLLKLEGCQYGGEIDRGFHNLVSDKLSISNFPKSLATEIFNSPEYLKFTVVRNPWDRLVSTYIDKFIRAKVYEDFALRVVESVNEVSGEKKNFISFSQFINYISSQSLLEMNDHWRPQWWFIAGICIDRVVKYENMKYELEEILASKGSFEKVPHINGLSRRGELRHTATQCDSMAVWDLYPDSLKEFTEWPSYNLWYDGVLREKVAAIYEKDIELFGYSFYE